MDYLYPNLFATSRIANICCSLNCMLLLCSLKAEPLLVFKVSIRLTTLDACFFVSDPSILTCITLLFMLSPFLCIKNRIVDRLVLS
nr:MAG TPA: hypothetical protein [Caudoviricetes sp.]